jgi:peroxiredoxin
MCKMRILKSPLGLLLILSALGSLSPAWGDDISDPYVAMGITRPDHVLPAHNFSLATLDGKHTSLNDYRGKVVLLNFWATWCAPCRKEMPSIQTLWDSYRNQDLVVLAVSEDDGERGQITKFIRKVNVNFPILLDNELKIGDSYMLPGLPTTYLIGRDGTIAATIVGTRDWSRREAQALIQYLLNRHH